MPDIAKNGAAVEGVEVSGIKVSGGAGIGVKGGLELGT